MPVWKKNVSIFKHYLCIALVILTYVFKKPYLQKFSFCYFVHFIKCCKNFSDEKAEFNF